MDTLVVIDQPLQRLARPGISGHRFALAAFDQNVSLFFTGPGVYWLLDGQNGGFGPKADPAVSATPMFGVEQLLFDPEACESRTGCSIAD